MTHSMTLEDLARENQELKTKIRSLELKNANREQLDMVSFGSMLFSLIQSLPLNIYAKDLDGYFIFANHFYCRNVGKTNEEIIGKSDFDIHPPDLAKKYIADDQRIMEKRLVESIEEEWKSIGGETNYVNVIKSPIYAYNDNERKEDILGTLGIFWDITERRKAEESLRKSEELYRDILENIQEGYFELNRNYSLSFFNNSFCTIMKRSEDQLIGSDFLQMAVPEKRRALKSFINLVLFQGSSSEADRFDFMALSEHNRILDLSITPRKEKETITGIRGIIRDITSAIEAENQKKHLEKQLQQVQKLESLGTLAGGIAHDFNNILFIIQGYTDLSIRDLEKKRNPLPKIKRIKDSCQRAKNLIEQILSFARHTESSKAPIDIRPIVKESLQLLRSVLPSTITIHTDIPADSDSFVYADPTEIHQVIMNLGTNAGQSMTESGGKIKVTIRKSDINKNNPVPGLLEGSYLHITFSDTGKGIPEENFAVIFEPFFTTKKVNEGTGLGLSVVHGIISGMDGRIFVDSKVNKGTTFNIYLPLTEKSLVKPPEKRPSIPRGNKELILLVDDDKALLSMLAKMLKELNYNCTPCDNGTEALALFQQGPEKYDLLFTDQTMPGFTGEALCIAVKSIKPDFPAILCTGFSEQITPEKIKEIGIDLFLSKPVLIENLAESIYKLLNGR